MQRYVQGWDEEEPSVVISGHQWPSAAIRGGKQWPSAAIGGGNHLGL
jgi:hypothetical protein